MIRFDRFAIGCDTLSQGAASMMMEWLKMPAHPASIMTELGARIKFLPLQKPYTNKIDGLLTSPGTGEIPIAESNAPNLKFTVTLTLADGREVLLD